jgi:hypothetical protein
MDKQSTSTAEPYSSSQPTIHMKTLALITLFALSCVISTYAQTSATVTDKQLDQAIARLRHINQSKMTDKQKEQMADDIDQAWKVIEKAGKPAIARLKQEVAQLDARKEKDDFFKLNVSAVLWNGGKLDEAEAIAAIWNSTPLTAQYNYVFYSAFEAARTQDPRALPMLRAVLRDKDGVSYVPQHAMDVRWPLSHEFIWGAYGSKGLPVLASVLSDSGFSVEQESSMVLLSEAQYLPALPRIRALARSPIASVRQTAIRCLGLYGHPEDFEFLISGLRLVNEEERFHYVYALYEYEDTRAVPHLIPMLKTENEFLRREVIATLAHLLSNSAIEALSDYCKDSEPMTAQRGECSQVDSLFDEVGVKLANYAKLSPAERQSFVADLRRKIEAQWQLQKDDKTLTHIDLIAALDEWKRNHRAFRGDSVQFSQEPGKEKTFVASINRFGWVEPRHILAVATDEDLGAIADVKAAVLGRLSDECLYETRKLDETVRRIGRQRYRTQVGLTDKAETKN